MIIGEAGGSGLSPPGDSSLEPIGIPTRPTAATEPIEVGDDADAAEFDATAPLELAHVPDAVPEAPPSNSAPGLDMPCVIVRPALPPHADVLPLIVPGTKLLGAGGLMPGDAI
jgi:hypothetical protein